jgi:hypothetical protein
MHSLSFVVGAAQTCYFPNNCIYCMKQNRVKEMSPRGTGRDNLSLDNVSVHGRLKVCLGSRLKDSTITLIISEKRS